MGIALFKKQEFSSELSLENNNVLIEDATTVKALFNVPITVNSVETNQFTTVFNKPEFSVVISNPEPFNIVIEKPTTITVVEDNEIRLFTANEDILPYQPVFINNDDSVSIAKSDSLESLNRFLGINTTFVSAGQQARVKITGTLYDDNFNWDVNREIYINGDGTLTQTPYAGAVYLQQVADVLSPKLILVTHNEPTLL